MTDASTSTDPAGTDPAGMAQAGTAPAGTGSEGAGPAAATFAADLPAKAADAVDLVVDTLFDKVIRPLVIVARAIVFGLLAAAVLLMIFVLLSIGFIRLLDVYAFGGRVWISYLVIGGIFTVLGAFAWSRRGSPATG